MKNQKLEIETSVHMRKLGRWSRYGHPHILYTNSGLIHLTLDPACAREIQVSQLRTREAG